MRLETKTNTGGENKMTDDTRGTHPPHNPPGPERGWYVKLPERVAPVSSLDDHYLGVFRPQMLSQIPEKYHKDGYLERCYVNAAGCQIWLGKHPLPPPEGLVLRVCSPQVGDTWTSQKLCIEVAEVKDNGGTVVCDIRTFEGVVKSRSSMSWAHYGAIACTLLDRGVAEFTYKHDYEFED